MNSVTYTTDVIEETTLVPDLDEDGNQKTDADGNLLYVEQTTSKNILHITISHLSAADEAAILGFNDEQLAELNELLDVKYASLWAQVLRGVGLGSNELVNLALSQLGNIISILFRLFLIGHKGTVYLGALYCIIVYCSHGLLGRTEIIINDICLMIGLRDKDLLRIFIQNGICPHGGGYHKGSHHGDKDQGYDQDHPALDRFHLISSVVQ